VFLNGGGSVTNFLIFLLILIDYNGNIKYKIGNPK